MRSGNEPMTARSPLRLRLTLAIFGVLASAAAAIGLSLTGHAGLAVVFAVIAAIACLNIIVVIVRIRQEPRFQQAWRDTSNCPGKPSPPARRTGRRTRR